MRSQQIINAYLFVYKPSLFIVSLTGVVLTKVDEGGIGFATLG